LSKGSEENHHQMVAENRKARHDYQIDDRLEVGLVLRGSEVKSIRNGQASIGEAFVRFERGEAWLVNAHISPYEEAAQFNHEPRRTRKLLLHRGEIEKWGRKVHERGYACIPLKLYIHGSLIKMEIGLGKGRKEYDKRQHLREQDDKRTMARALKERG
jgi:SsrA-binding protein